MNYVEVIVEGSSRIYKYHLPQSGATLLEAILRAEGTGSLGDPDGYEVSTADPAMIAGSYTFRPIAAMPAGRGGGPGVGAVELANALSSGFKDMAKMSTAILEQLKLVNKAIFDQKDERFEVAASECSSGGPGGGERRVTRSQSIGERPPWGSPVINKRFLQQRQTTSSSSLPTTSGACSNSLPAISGSCSTSQLGDVDDEHLQYEGEGPWCEAEAEDVRYEAEDLMYEAQREQIFAQQLLEALRIPGMCEDLGLATPPTACQPLTRAAYAQSIRPMVPDGNGGWLHAT